MGENDDPGFEADSPSGNGSKPKSSKKFWLFGGLGCLGLLGLVCAAGIGAAFYFGKPAIDFLNENISIIEASPKTSETLGAPFSLAPPKTSQDPNKPGVIIFSGDALGPSKSGTYVIEATMEGSKFERQAIYLEVGGEQIDLDPDSLFDFEIDDGT